MSSDPKPDTDTTPVPRWEPSAAWAIPVVVVVWVWAAGWLPLWAARQGAPIPAPAMALGGPLLGVVVAARVRAAWEYGHAPWLSDVAVWLAALTGVSAGGWLWLAAGTHPWPQTPLLLLLGGGLGVAWWALAAVLAPRAAHRVADVPAAAPAPAQPLDGAGLRALLNTTGMAGVDIVEYRPTRAGHSWLLGPRLVDAEGAPLDELPDFADFSAALPRLTQRLAAYWRGRGVQLEDGDLRPEPVAVDRWWLHLNTAHVEKEEVPATLAPPPRAWTATSWLGLYLDGRAIEVALCGRHMKVVGATGGGKTVVTNNVIRAAVTAAQAGRRDCHVWVVATDKLVPLVWPWLQGYLSGRDRVPVLDWPAGHDPDMVLRALAAAYRLARSRNRDLDDESSVRVTPDAPGLLVVWEEAKHGGRQDHTIEIDGEEFTISGLVNAIMQMSRASGVGILAVTQDGLYEGTGPYGDEMMRNFTVRACTVTETESDGRFTLPKLAGQGVDTTQLRDHTIYLQPSMADDARAMPGKVSNLDGTPLVDPVVQVAAAAPLPRWSPADLAALGEDYARRWDPARCPELVRACTRRGWGWRPAELAPPTARGHDEDDEQTEPEAPAGGDDGEDEHVENSTGDRQWADALAALTDAAAGVPRPASSKPVDRVSDARRALPSAADVARLDEIAARMMAEVAAGQGAAHSAAEPHGSPAGGPESAPEPIPSVWAAVAALPDGTEWVPTAELAWRVWGTERAEAVATLGRAIARHVPAARTTDPRPYTARGTARRGRGYVVSELAAALADYRG